MGKKKLVEKIADAVENMIHPDHAPQEGADHAEKVESPIAGDEPKLESSSEVPVDSGSSSHDSDFQKHPKFAKFNSRGDNQP